MARSGKLRMTFFKDYALPGAQQRAAELEAELAEIRRAFPSLGTGRAVKAGAAERVLRPARRRRKPMSEAQKKAVGIRMKKYWAARRAAKAKA